MSGENSCDAEKTSSSDRIAPSTAELLRKLLALGTYPSPNHPVSYDASDLALIGETHHPGFVYFVSDTKYLRQLPDGSNAAVICHPRDASEVDRAGLVPLLSKNPSETFFLIYNEIAANRISLIRKPSSIHPGAEISPSATISRCGVVIQDGVVVGPNAVIFERVKISQGSKIGAGAVIGDSGFEYKLDSNGQFFKVLHDGVVEIGKNCEVGALSYIGQGFWRRPTKIGDGSKIDTGVLIAHGTSIGAHNLIAAGSKLAGSCSTGASVWVGPGASVSNGLRIGSRARIGIGSVVLTDVPSDASFFGNPARPTMKKKPISFESDASH